MQYKILGLVTLLAFALASAEASAEDLIEEMVPAVGPDIGFSLNRSGSPVITLDAGLISAGPSAWFGPLVSVGYDWYAESPIAAASLTAGLYLAGFEVGVVTDADDLGMRFRAIFPTGLFGVYFGVDRLKDTRIMAGVVLRFPMDSMF